MSRAKHRRPRKSVRCTLCTPYRWMGNSSGRFKKPPPPSSFDEFVDSQVSYPTIPFKIRTDEDPFGALESARADDRADKMHAWEEEHMAPEFVYEGTREDFGARTNHGYKKRKKTRPFAIEVRYTDDYAERSAWARRDGGVNWKLYRRYATERGRDDALRALSKGFWARHHLYRAAS